MNFLRQSTAVDIAIGPFVDATDGVTAETGLTISQADVRLKKNNGAWAQVNDNTSATHEENGWYEKELDATDTNTVGILLIAVHESGALPVWHEFQVLEEAVYDQLFAASATGAVPIASIANGAITAAAIATGAIDADAIAADVSTELLSGLAGLAVNVTQISGDSAAADNLETSFDDTAGAVRWMGIVDQGTAQSATGTTLVLRAAAAFADDELIGATIQITGGSTGVGQTRLITDYVSATDTATVEAWNTTPTGTITYRVYGTAPASGGSGLDAAGVRAAIGMASANLDTQLAAIESQTDDIGVAGAGLTAVPWNAAWDAEVQSECTDALNAYDPPTRAEATSDANSILTAVDAVPTNAELATALGTADDAVLAQVALVKAQTDKFANLPVLTAGGAGGQGYGAP